MADYLNSSKACITLLEVPLVVADALDKSEILVRNCLDLHGTLNKRRRVKEDHVDEGVK